MSNKTYAKRHAILPRKGDNAVVFRRGPSSCVAVKCQSCGKVYQRKSY